MLGCRWDFALVLRLASICLGRLSSLTLRGLFRCLASYLAGWFVGWLIGRSVGRLVGQLVSW